MTTILRSGCAAALFFATALAMSAPSLDAQKASYRIVGSSCTSGRLVQASGPVPFQVIGTPRLGSTFQIESEPSGSYLNGPRRLAFLMTGASNTSAGGVRLPFDIGLLASQQDRACGLLRTSMEVVSFMPFERDLSIRVRVPIEVPNNAALRGMKFYQQVLSVEISSFGPPFRGLTLSAGGEGTVGD